MMLDYERISFQKKAEVENKATIKDHGFLKICIKIMYFISINTL